jgi:type IV pilus assembly protein PilQ
MRRIQTRPATVLSMLFALAVWGSASLAGAETSHVARHATDIRLGTDAGFTRVVVEFNKQPDFTARLESSKRRLIVDVPDADLRGAPSAITKPTGVVGGVMAQAFETARGATTRVLVTLLRAAKYSVKVEGNSLVLTFKPGAPGVLDAAEAGTPTRGAEDRPAATVNDVRFESTQERDRVLIDLSHIPKYQKLQESSGRLVLALEGTHVPESLERTLDVTAFHGRVNSISTYTDPRRSTRTLVEIQAGPSLVQSVEVEGHTLAWNLSPEGQLPSSMTGVARDGGVARRTRTVHRERALRGVPEVHSGYPGPRDDMVETTTEPDRAAGFTAGTLAQQKRYSGPRVDLDLKDADIRNVLRLLADVGRVNIVAADNVTGMVTLRLRNVPWDQALDVVLQAKNLGMIQQGNMIRVAPLADLEKERDMQIARRKQEIQLAPLETRLIPISYAEAEEIQKRAGEMLSERGSIAVDQRTNTLIARDLAGNLNQVEELVRALDTQTPQVLVEARIVEATSRYQRDVGIQWGGDASFSAATGNPTGLVFPNSVGVVGGASDSNTPTAGMSPFSNTVETPNFAVNLPATVGTDQGGAIGFTFGSIDNTINLGVRLSAAESSGMVRILSSPRVLTLDNREARIAQGTMIPFSQVSAQGVQTTFQEAKLQLLVKPHVTADGSVSMHVKINRDEPDFNQTSARGDPTILKREAETDLLVTDGHTAVIGGMFTRNTGRNLDQVPFFGDIPLLGLLFQRRRASDTRAELVIFLTPRIVNRAEALGH